MRSTASSMPIYRILVRCLNYFGWLSHCTGFIHSAFAIRVEGQLERSPHALKHIPRGELVELLSKALLYLEVESHWKGDSLTANCKSRFSLLEPHVCSLEPPSDEPLVHMTVLPPSDLISKTSKTNGVQASDSGTKRKSSPTATLKEGPAEKRQKSTSEDVDMDKSQERRSTVRYI